MADKKVETTLQTDTNGERIGGHDEVRRSFGLHVPAKGKTSYSSIVAILA